MLEAFERHADEFRRLTRRAPGHFLARDWPALRADAEARLLAYPRHVAEVVVRLGQLSQWQPIRPDITLRRFAGAVAGRPDAELARTFYNSAMRRVLGTVGTDARTEFLELDPAPVGPASWEPTTWSEPERLAPLLADALAKVAPARAWDPAGLDPSRLVACLVDDHPDLREGGAAIMLQTPFYRGRRAFVIGRLETSHRSLPLILPVVHGREGIRVDAVVTSPDEVSMIFGFTRTHFHVDLPVPRRTVSFLHSLLPGKRIDELYTVLGHHKHGKREFYQRLVAALEEPDGRFEVAEGVPGMVMVVFTLQALNVVFKVIRDRAVPPKMVTRPEVMAKYELVFRQEYGGRLAETQQFEDLSLPLDAFAPEVRDDLLAHAAETVRRSGEWLVLDHLYTERRMTPLDLYLRRAPEAAARAAAVDFGQAIKELAEINVFPGDMLTKNFGVTRHGRVVFYDYDEIVPLDRCVFRTLPQPTTPEQEMAAEPWYPVREHDVFPEEFERFLRFRDPLHDHFLEHHRELFTAEYWQEAQARVRRDGVSETAPYTADARLAPAP